MKKIEVNVLTFDEFKSQIIDGRFEDRRVFIEDGDYYIKDDLIEWQMLETDLLVLFHDGSIATIDSEDVIFA